MNSKKIIILGFALVLGGLLFYAGLDTATTNDKPSSHPQNKEKLPNDYMFMQRAYPTGQIKSGAYAVAAKWKKALSSQNKNADAVYNWLIQKGISQDSIIAHGRSLGGASAAYIATTKKLKGLILESTFTSIPDMASYRFPWLPTSILCTTKLDTGERVKSYQGKTLVLHSPDDQVIPFQMGKELAETTSTELVLLKGGHNDVFLQRQRYKLALEKFLNSL